MTQQQQHHEDYRVPLAEAMHEGARRAPLLAFFVLAILAILGLGWLILEDTSRERSEQRARIAELTEDLVHCHQVRNAMRGMSAQNNTKP